MWNQCGNNPNVNEISLKYASYCPNFKIASITGSPKLYYICIHTLQYYSFLGLFCLWFTCFFFFLFFKKTHADTSSACLFYSLMPQSLLILLLLSFTDDITSTFNFLLIPTSPLTRATVYVFHILTIFYVLNIALFS